MNLGSFFVSSAMRFRVALRVRSRFPEAAVRLRAARLFKRGFVLCLGRSALFRRCPSRRGRFSSTDKPLLEWRFSVMLFGWSRGCSPLPPLSALEPSAAQFSRTSSAEADRVRLTKDDAQRLSPPVGLPLRPRIATGGPTWSGTPWACTGRWSLFSRS